MKQLVVLILVISFNSMGFSQESRIDSVLSKKQNVEWIDKFEKLTSMSERIAEIKKKIYADSIFIREKPYNRIGCRIVFRKVDTLRETFKRVNCECKIVFILGFKKSSYLLEPIEHPKTNKILEFVNEKNIDKITVLQGDIASALYGTNGKCGVVVMYSNSRKLKGKVKKVS